MNENYIRCHSLLVSHRYLLAVQPLPLSKFAGVRPPFTTLFHKSTWLADLDRSVRHEPPPKILTAHLGPLGRLGFGSRARFRDPFWSDAGDDADDDGDPYFPRRASLVDRVRRDDEIGFGFAPKAADERMHYLFLRLDRRVQLSAQLDGKQRALGYLDVRLHPCGFVSVHLRLRILRVRDMSLRDLRASVIETRAWRRGGRWQWSSRLGTDTLPGIVDRAIAHAEHSILKPPARLTRAEDWSSLLAAETDGVEWSDRDAARALVGDVGARFDIRVDSFEHERQTGDEGARDLLGTPAATHRLYKGSDGLLLTFPANEWHGTTRRFARVQRMADFVSLKLGVYWAYADWLRDELEGLREVRLSVRERVTKDDVTRFSVYRKSLPKHLRALDSLIRPESAHARAVYSFVSDQLGFSEIREKLQRRVAAWEEEVGKWEQPLLWALGKVGKPLKRLLIPK